MVTKGIIFKHKHLLLMRNSTAEVIQLKTLWFRARHLANELSAKAAVLFFAKSCSATCVCSWFLN